MPGCVLARNYERTKNKISQACRKKVTLKGITAVNFNGTEQPHSYIIQIGSEIMGKGARDLCENENNHGSFHLNRAATQYTTLSHTRFHLKQ